MKVLQINAVGGIRSTGRLSSEIDDYLNANGHEGYQAYSYGKSGSHSYIIGSTLDHKTHAFLSHLFGLQAYFSHFSTMKLLKHIEKIKPDVVHLHNLHNNFINLKMLTSFLSKNKIPTLYTQHDCWGFTGKCGHFTVTDCYRWKTGCGECPRLKKDNKSWFFDRTHKMVRDKKKWFGSIPKLAVVGVSDWLTEHASKAPVFGNAISFRRIYNWVDLEKFKPLITSTEEKERLLGLKDKFIILGVASGWGKDKGLESFLGLAKLLPEDMKIVLVGRMSSGVILPHNIVHIRETHNVDEMVEFYNMADVFVHLSPEETFGMVTAEALACGTPAIVLNCTANPEVVGEGCGYVAESDYAEEILTLINEVKSKGKSFFSEKCIAFARENFNKEDRIKDYINCYEELLSSK